MSLTLTDADLASLQGMIDELRHKDALPILQFFVELQNRQRAAAAFIPPANPLPVPNGSAETVAIAH